MDNRIEEVMSTALLRVREIADVNTVVGKPFSLADGRTVIPVSKVTVGVLTGGGEYGAAHMKRQEDYPFSGGGGAAVSLTPVGFLIAGEEGIRMMTAQDTGPFDKLFEAASGMVEKWSKKQSREN